VKPFVGQKLSSFGVDFTGFPPDAGGNEWAFDPLAVAELANREEPGLRFVVVDWWGEAFNGLLPPVPDAVLR